MYVDIFSLNAFLTHYSRILTHYLLQFDTKCRPFANFRAFYIDFSTMIRLNDPFYQRQSQAQPRFFVVYPGLKTVLNFDFRMPLPVSITSIRTLLPFSSI